jgi:short-subunit dehydrogenase
MNKVSVVTGGSGGLGLSIAEILTKSGKNVLILGRNKRKLEEAEKRLIALEAIGSIYSLNCNIGNKTNIEQFCDFISHNKLSVDYLYNNAGKGLFANADQSSSEMIDEIFEANLKGMILLTSAVLRITPDNEELTIVNIMSTSALFGRAEETIYCAAKWGARGFTEALRTELKGTKRNIIAVYPGGMRTDFWKAPGQNRDTSSFMDPAEVAEKIVNAVIVSDKMLVTDITINRKK